MPIKTIALDSLKSAITTLPAPPQPTGMLGGAVDTPDNGLLFIIALVIALDAFLASLIRRCMRCYRSELIGVRKRNNAFDNTGTAPLGGTLLLAVNLMVFGGTALYYAVVKPHVPVCPETGIAVCSAAAGALYVFHYIAYTVVGYAFTDPENSRRWRSGFIAAQGFTALGLIIPTLLLLFLPEYASLMLTLCAIIYLIFKFSFICKGFRIFYSNFGSSLYFILYLCSLEIIPVICAYSMLASTDTFHRLYNNSLMF